MGWGTFIAGRVLGPRTRSSGAIGEGLAHAAKVMENRTYNVEAEVLDRIRELKSLGEEIDIDQIRREVYQIQKYRRKRGRRLEIEIVREAQKYEIAGEKFDVNQIERDLFNRRRVFSWKTFFIWLFLPEWPLYKLIRGSRSQNRENR
jgi:hypothetical protein